MCAHVCICVHVCLVQGIAASRHLCVLAYVCVALVWLFVLQAAVAQYIPRILTVPRNVPALRDTDRDRPLDR